MVKRLPPQQLLCLLIRKPGPFVVAAVSITPAAARLHNTCSVSAPLLS
jgi:hypothetical protein